MLELTLEGRSNLTRKIKIQAQGLGANLVGIANAERWDQEPMTEPEYRPQNIWPWARSVIVMGMQIYLPMLETTPSVVYSELYNTSNRLLDEIAYRLANSLFSQGFRAHYFPRDCYGDISVLVEKPEAAFSHVIAGYYAGLGTIGENHTLLTREYGPRVRLVSVITDALLDPDDMIKEDLCIHCGRCVRECPIHAFVSGENKGIADMDTHKCARYHQHLKGEFRYPCGRCTAVCPVGLDRKIYGINSVSPEGIEHVRNFGSLNAIKKAEAK